MQWQDGSIYITKTSTTLFSNDKERTEEHNNAGISAATT